MANVKGPLVLGLLILAAGIALLAWAVSSGDAEFYLFIIFPVVTGTGPVFAGGALLFMIGLMGTFIGLSMGAAPRDGPQFGGVIFIGPIPIVFGKGQRTSKWMLVGSIVFGILLIVFLLGIFL
jgi:uncharacterized membrane protein